MPFDNAKHPRDGVGRFASDGAAPSMRTATHTQEPRRSLTRNSRVWSIGARTQELPSSYTGSVTKEHEVGTFLHHKLTAQIPKSVGVEDWSTLMRRLYTTIVEAPHADDRPRAGHAHRAHAERPHQGNRLEGQAG
ncbi:MAG: hypothetical protein WDN04_13740 [Rhodospirillales bacterium]